MKRSLYLIIELSILLLFLLLNFNNNNNNIKDNKRGVVSVVNAATPNKSQLIKDAVARMNNKCVISMQGLDCPNDENDLMTKTSLLRSTMRSNDLFIVAGVGYSRVDHSIKPQILQSPLAVRMSSEETVSKSMNSAEDYFGMLYPKDGSTVFNGLFSHGATATDLIFSQFFAGNFKMMNSQKQVFTHNVELSSVQVTSEFQQIIDILPNEMDESLYRLVIDSFGDSITTKVKYGGVVDMTVSIRSCFSDPSMMKYLENQLHLTIDGQTPTDKLPNGYVRYHKVDSLDIIGGNPQIQSIKQRIASFESNPVPVRMEFIPIWRAFPTGAKQENMKKVYNKYIEENSKTVENQIKELNDRRNQENLKEQPFFIYASDSTNGFISKFTSDVQVAAGQRVVIDKTFRKTEWVGVFHNLKVNFLSYIMQPVIIRNSDGSFSFEFNYQMCEIKNNVPSDSCKPSAWPVPGKEIKSKTVSNKCEKVTLKSPGTDVVYNDLIVCSGCQPFISANFKDISCECPYVK